MVLLIIIVLITICLYYILKQFLKFKRLMKAFPGFEDSHPIIGDALKFSPEPDKLFAQLRKLNELFPKGYGIWMGWYGAVFITTPEQAKVILSSPRYINKTLSYEFLKPWLKTGLLTSNGDKWAKRRKLLTQAYHFNILKDLTKSFEEHIEYLLELLEEESKNDKTDVTLLMSKVTLNIICGTSLGVSLDVNDKKSNDYRQAIYDFHAIYNARLVKPWLIPNIMFRFHPLYQLQKKLTRTLHSFTSDVIGKREKILTENKFDDEEVDPKKKLTLLDLLLSIKRNTGEIDDEGIREEVETFTFAGHDTVAVAISFALMLIACHEEHQKKIIEELDDIFGDSNRKINYQDLQNMVYMELCIKESMRLYPSVSIIARTEQEDIPLDDKYIIPKGAITAIQIYDIHHNKDHFPDPEKFDPERFLPENSKDRHPYAYIPFSTGPRNCIGQKFAMQEMKSLLAAMLRKYELKPVDTRKTIVLTLDLVLRAKNGIHVKFVPRVK